VRADAGSIHGNGRSGADGGARQRLLFGDTNTDSSTVDDRQDARRYGVGDPSVVQ
jgi:hypothetical protein